MKIQAALCFGFFLGLGLLCAQQPEAVVVPPSGPLIKDRAPQMARWSITRSGPASKIAAASEAGGEPKPKGFWGSKVTFTKTDDITRQDTLDEQGRVWTTWCLKGLQITVWPDGKTFVQEAPARFDPENPPALYTDFSRSDFPGFEWISKKNFSALEEVDGRKRMIFKDVEPPPSSDPAEAALPAIPRVAVVDLETRLPVSLSRGGETKKYEFLSPPEAKQALPAVVLTLLDNRAKGIEAATRRSTKAY